jgi:glycosyltransferase involved in cell wall biosynthesis
LIYWNTLWTLLQANWGSLRYFGGVLALFPKIVYFAKLMAEEGIDHIHAHFASHPAAAGFVIHRLVGIPYSFTAHGSDLHRDRHMLREKVEEAAFVVPISNYNQEMIVAECKGQYSDKVIVIHCGVDTSVFQPRITPTSHELGKGPFAILCIGMLHEVKGQTYLIHACQELKQRGIDFTCHFIGDGPDEAMLKRQTAVLGLAEHVKFHGRLAREQIVTLLHDADVVATPSVPTRDGRREGIPVVLMEAMGSGVAVIASRLSGIPELVLEGTCGLLIEPRDVNGLAAGLEQLYRDPELRRRFGQEGRKQVLENFDLMRNAEVLAGYFRL